MPAARLSRFVAAGRLLAYLGHPNRFTVQDWYPELRVLDTRTGESATLLRSAPTYGAPGVSLLWLP